MASESHRAGSFFTAGRHGTKPHLGAGLYVTYAKPMCHLYLTKGGLKLRDIAWLA